MMILNFWTLQKLYFLEKKEKISFRKYIVEQVYVMKF